MLDVPYELIEHVSWRIYTRGRELRLPRRKSSCFEQALLALAHLRKNETFAQVGAGFGGSGATAWRYVDETLEVLGAEPAPDPGRAERGRLRHRRQTLIHSAYRHRRPSHPHTLDLRLLRMKEAH